MKTTHILPALAIILVAAISACTGGTMTDSKRAFLRDAAINRIAAFNAAGIQILELDPVQLLILDTACFAATTFAVLNAGDATADMDLPKSIVDTCSVIMILAAGDNPVPVPMGVPIPEPVT